MRETKKRQSLLKILTIVEFKWIQALILLFFQLFFIFEIFQNKKLGKWEYSIFFKPNFNSNEMTKITTPTKYPLLKWQKEGIHEHYLHAL